MGGLLILVVCIVLGVLLSRVMAKYGASKLVRRSLATLVGSVVFLAAIGVYAGNVDAPAAPVAKPHVVSVPLLGLNASQYLAALHQQFGDKMKGKSGADSLGDEIEASPSAHVKVFGESDVADKNMKLVVVTISDTKTTDQLRTAFVTAGKALHAAVPQRDFAPVIQSLADEQATYAAMSPRQLGRYVLTTTIKDQTHVELRLTAGNAHPNGAPDDNSTYALTACQSAVKERLRSPASAKFTDRHVTQRDPHDGNRYRVIGEVDSQNGFGAMLRSYWVCRAGYIAGAPFEDTSWNVADVDISER